jgi:superfamily I DNA/RNA helicase
VIAISNPVPENSGAVRVWSPQQNAIFAAIEDESKRHLVVEALAGTGKTSTVVEAVRHTCDGDTVAVFAFNKSIADELKRRSWPDGVHISTFHSFGLRAVTSAYGSREVDARACGNRLKASGGFMPFDVRRTIEKLVSFAKATLAKQDVGSLIDLLDTAEIDVPKSTTRQAVAVKARAILEATAADELGPIDYDDMVWLPVVQGLTVKQHDWVFVDETQDLNACQLALARMACKPEGRIVAVGDRRQAIYGFRGADREAIPRMIRELDAEVLPLSVTYRCPIAVVEEANHYVPALEAAPGASTGLVTCATEHACFECVKPGDFVISRVNAPLVSLCFRLLAAGRKARIQGRDIGQGLATWIKDRRARDVPELVQAIRGWERAEIARLAAEEKDTLSVTDKAACLIALCEGESRVAGVLLKVETLFADNGPGVVLTSTHRAKGLEADRVWLLWDTYRDNTEEERNLCYVAITRSKGELIYVTTDSISIDEIGDRQRPEGFTQ